MRRLLPLLLISFGIGACSGSQHGAPEPVAPGPVASEGAMEEPRAPLPPPDEGVRQLLATQYEALSRLDAEAFATPWADDAVVVGPSPSDLLVGRDRAIDAVRRHFDEEIEADRLEVESLGMRIRVPEGTRCAWAFDQLRVVDGRRAIRMHMTSIAVETPAGYRMVAQSWTYPLPNIVAWARAGQGGLPAPVPVPEAVGEGAAPVREAVRRWAERRDFGTFSGREDTLLVGTSADDIIEGDEAIREELQGLVDDPDVTLEIDGGVLARTTCGGRLAFVAFNQTFVVGHAHLPIPTRALAFYEREGPDYRPVLLFTTLVDAP